MGISMVIAGFQIGCEQQVSSLEMVPKEMAIYSTEDVQTFSVKAVDREGESVVEPNIIWKSSDTEVVEINDEGVITVKGSGTATISALIDNLKEDVSVKVDLCTALTAESPEITVNVGATAAPVVHAMNDKGMSSASPIEWLTEDSAIATVDDKGVITGVAAGDTTATVACGAQTVAIKVHVATAGDSVAENAQQQVPVEVPTGETVVPAAPAEAAEELTADEHEAAADKEDGDRALDNAF